MKHIKTFVLRLLPLQIESGEGHKKSSDNLKFKSYQDNKHLNYCNTALIIMKYVSYMYRIYITMYGIMIHVLSVFHYCSTLLNKFFQR